MIKYCFICHENVEAYFEIFYPHVEQYDINCISCYKNRIVQRVPGKKEENLSPPHNPFPKGYFFVTPIDTSKNNNTCIVWWLML